MSRLNRIFVSAAIFLVALLPSAAMALDHGEKKVKKTEVRVKARQIDRVERDVDRLEALLIGLNNNVTFDQATLQRIANEANMLANRISANVRTGFTGRATRDDAVKAAADLRTHVRLLHKEAHAGDLADARQHAREALPFALRIDDLAG